MKQNIPHYFEQESERLMFRKVTIDDIENWKEFFEHNDRLHFVGADLSKSIDELSETWIRKQLDRYKNEGLGLLAVIEKTSGLLIGMGGIIQREIDGKPEFEIAYSLKPKFWKKGYGTEVANQMRLFGTEHGISDNFISIIDKENHDSRNVAEKNTMKIIKETEFMGMSVFIYGTTSRK